MVPGSKDTLFNLDYNYYCYYYYYCALHYTQRFIDHLNPPWFNNTSPTFISINLCICSIQNICINRAWVVLVAFVFIVYYQSMFKIFDYNVKGTIEVETSIFKRHLLTQSNELTWRAFLITNINPRTCSKIESAKNILIFVTISWQDVIFVITVANADTSAWNNRHTHTHTHTNTFYVLVTSAKMHTPVPECHTHTHTHTHTYIYIYIYISL